MKRITLLSIALLFSIVMFSQIKTIKTTKPVLVGKVSHFDCYKYDSTYTFTYTDVKYQQIIEKKSFNLSEKDFNDFYNLLMKNFEDMPEEPTTIETPNDILRLKYQKAYGNVNVQISQMVNKNTDVIGLTKWITKKATIKLFGKKK